jgi:SAM-dependent methyltransferase
MARLAAARFASSVKRKMEEHGRFQDQLDRFEALSRESKQRFTLDRNDLYPCLTDATATTAFDHHYVYHPAWAARILARTRPDHHVDVSSSVYFCTMLSAFIPVTFYDYRPAEITLSGLESKRGDLHALPFASKSQNSISCMHTVEHVGLGRYGDKLDYDGDLKAIAELQRVVAPGGSLLFVVPVGKPRIQFNAHRIYAYEQVVSYFPELELKEFALVEDESSGGAFIANATEADANRQAYGCGCFWFQRPAN